MCEYFSIRFELADVHDFRHQLHVVAIGRHAQHPETLFAEPLEAVRRAARLERSAAEDFGARRSHRRRCRLDLFVGLRRAGPGHDDDLVAADAEIVDDDNGVVWLEGAAGELVRLGNPHDLLHAVENLEQPRVELSLTAHRAEHRSQRARGPVHVETHAGQLRDDALNLLVRRKLLHDHYHDVSAFSV